MEDPGASERNWSDGSVIMHVGPDVQGQLVAVDQKQPIRSKRDGLLSSLRIFTQNALVDLLHL